MYTVELLKITSSIRNLHTKIKTKIKAFMTTTNAPEAQEASKRFGKDTVMEESPGSVNKSSNSAKI